MAGPFSLRWGIMATGNMARQFVEDLLIDPTTRDVHDIRHIISAVASSSAQSTAQSFIEKHAGSQAANAVAHGSYELLAKDPSVDIIYIATPTSLHYEHAMLCLNNGKHVLCEKAFTINAKQTANLISRAKEKQLFLAEALWTRYFPIFHHIRDLLHSTQVLGKIHRVISDISIRFTDPGHSIRNHALGGGALLAVGLYPLTWAMMAIHESVEPSLRALPEVQSTIIMASHVGSGQVDPADENTNALLTWKDIKSTAIVSSSLNLAMPKEHSVFIQGEKGNLTIPWASFRPESYILALNSTESSTHRFHIPGKGLFYQADACARAIREGKTETEEYPLMESLALMQVMDAIRYNSGFHYQNGLEDA